MENMKPYLERLPTVFEKLKQASCVKLKALLLLVPVFLFFVLTAEAAHTIASDPQNFYEKDSLYYTVQAGSFSKTQRERAIAAAKQLHRMGIQQVRVEELAQFFVIRAGFFDKRTDAEKKREMIENVSPGTLLTRAYYRPERIVHTTGEDLPATVVQQPGSPLRITPPTSADTFPFYRRASYTLPIFRGDTTFVTPVNDHSFWFEIPPGMIFTAPFFVSLDYSYSETLLPGEGAITVYLNGRPAASRRFPGTTLQKTPWVIRMDRAFLKPGFNELRITSRHRSSRELCADSENSANWLKWHDTSHISITRQPLSSLPLNIYPYPYLDKFTADPVNSVWRLPKNFTSSQLELLLSLANSWGSSHPDLPLRIRVSTGPSEIEHMNEIFFSGEILNSYNESGNRGLVENRIFRQDEKKTAQLFLAGYSKEGFAKSVNALRTGMLSTSGLSRMEINNLPEITPTLAKNAYRATTFAEMGISDIIISGAFSQKAKILIHRPLLTPLGKDSYINLNFRHSDALRPERSLLSISINGIFVNSVRLHEKNKEDGSLSVRIPVNQLAKNAWLVELDLYHYIGSVDCGKKHEEIAWTVIADDSFIKLNPGRVLGYPYLDYFPYLKDSLTRQPRRAVMWLPENPSDNQLTSAAVIAARAGQVNNADITWKVFMGNDPGQTINDENVILIRSPLEINSLPASILKSMHIEKHGDLYNINNNILPLDYKLIDGNIVIQASESAFNRQNIFYSIIADDGSLEDFNRTLAERKTSDLISGGVVLISSGNDIKPFPIVDGEIIKREIKAERNRYTLPMMLIMGFGGLVLLVAALLLIHLVRRPRKKTREVEQKA